MPLLPWQCTKNTAKRISLQKRFAKIHVHRLYKHNKQVQKCKPALVLKLIINSDDKKKPAPASKIFKKRFQLQLQWFEKKNVLASPLCFDKLQQEVHFFVLRKRAHESISYIFESEPWVFGLWSLQILSQSPDLALI